MICLTSALSVKALSGRNRIRENYKERKRLENMKSFDVNLIIGNNKVPVYVTTFNDEGYSLVLTSAYFTQKITLDKSAAEELYNDLEKYLNKE
jgi:hypothetical protein